MASFLDQLGSGGPQRQRCPSPWVRASSTSGLQCSDLQAKCSPKNTAMMWGMATDVCTHFGKLVRRLRNRPGFDVDPPGTVLTQAHPDGPSCIWAPLLHRLPVMSPIQNSTSKSAY